MYIYIKQEVKKGQGERERGKEEKEERIASKIKKSNMRGGRI